MTKPFLDTFSCKVNGESREFQVIAANDELVLYNAVLKQENGPHKLSRFLSSKTESFQKRTGWRAKA